MPIIIHSNVAVVDARNEYGTLLLQFNLRPGNSIEYSDCHNHYVHGTQQGKEGDVITPPCSAVRAFSKRASPLIWPSFSAWAREKPRGRAQPRESGGSPPAPATVHEPSKRVTATAPPAIIPTLNCARVQPSPQSCCPCLLHSSCTPPVSNLDIPSPACSDRDQAAKRLVPYLGAIVLSALASSRGGSPSATFEGTTIALSATFGR